MFIYLYVIYICDVKMNEEEFEKERKKAIERRDSVYLYYNNVEIARINLSFIREAI